MKKLLLLIPTVFSAVVFVNAQTQVLTDTDLELTGAGGTQWSSTSTNFGTVMCDVGTCGTCGGPCAPHSGTYFAWFGGSGSAEVGTLTQTFNVASGGVATLSFYLMMPNAGVSADSIAADLDGTNVWFKLGDDTTGFENAYAIIDVNIASITSGSHTLTFRGNETGTASGSFNSLIDDITLTVGGTAGVSDFDFESGITTYVNYDQQIMNIAFNFSAASDVTMFVTDMSGRRIAMKNFNNIQNEYITYNTYGWAAGVYNVTFIKGNDAITKKLFVK